MRVFVKKILARNVYFFILFSGVSSLNVAVASKAEEANEISTGTGWVVAPHFVVTNYHVVGDANTVLLVRTDNREFKADVIMRDPVNDVAILKPRKLNLIPPGLPIANSAANVGASIFTIGYPLISIMGREPKLTTGYVNARTGISNDPRTYQISVPIQPGNSGGPVFNMSGEVIGIATSSLSAAKVFNWSGNLPQNVNYAVKSNYVRVLLDASPVQNSKTIDTLSRNAANLETLVKRVKDSILIVIAANKDSKQAAQSTDSASETDTDKGEVKKTELTNSWKNYSLFVYAVPHNYDLRENFIHQGVDDTIDNYSTSLSKVIKDFIKKSSNGKIALKEEYTGNSAEDIHVSTLKHSKRNSICKRQNVDFLFTAATDNYSFGITDITYYIFDCKDKNEFYYTKSLQSKNSDHFMYEWNYKNLLNQIIPNIPGMLKSIANK